MADDEIPPGQRFDFMVSEPKRTTGMAPFWTYHVRTKTTFPSYRQKDITVLRRYNDFVWLRDQLVAEYPGVIVPPVPEKTIAGTVEKVTGGAEPTPLVEYRMRAMRKFLVRVGAHEQLQKSDILREFLELSEPDFKRRTAEGTLRKDPIDMGLSQKIQAELMKKKATDCDREQREWDETFEYAAQFQSYFLSLRDQFEKVVKRKKENTAVMSDLGRAFFKASEHEAAFERGDVSNSLNDLATGVENVSLIVYEQADVETTQVIETISYYVGICEAIKETVRRLQRAILRKGHLKDTLGKTKLKMEGMIDGESKVKLSIQADTLQDDLKYAENVVSNFSKVLTVELTRFHREKAYDIKQLLTTWSSLQQEYGLRVRTRWEDLVGKT